MSQKKTSILYLDDEDNNLTAFKASFRREFTVFVTTKADEAVDILKHNEVHLIIADQKMPDISGVEFLELVKSEFPDPIRILLTGYADIEAVIDAINRGQVYRYITKPWDEQDLRMVFNNARDHYETKRLLSKRNVELEQANKDLSSFIYSASHDLRSPIASIKGISDLANEEDNYEKLKQLHKMIRTEIFQLDYYTQNLINYYQNLRDDHAYEEFDTSEWVESLKCKLIQLLPDYSFELSTKLSPIFFGDKHRLTAIATNILANAVSHSQGDEKVDVHITTEGNDTHEILIIEDRTSIIDSQRVQEIGEMLAGKMEPQPGKGMGLFVVSEITRKLKADLDFKPREGKGVEVTIKFPKEI